ncbi:cytochrome c biogenesis protein ResB [Nocardioides sp. TRM66260-LWL]|uniref:cytochrome c biogenesis protein ResB n=1 Tax=Nocardioides sp. TRM66260-LWL TaxID=2874478 RepID=UPI001CC34C51|nr:cytochrome c biogenesis protein ResB [Nocardioides sp. TRM66260-LWL]MBZ5734803.1 cytochrome c biogenesis protein ResB [Nocardioides sp. TRM66260-LWL]
MTTIEKTPRQAPTPERRPGELTFRELLRFGWRQLTSMRTALVLLLLLALAAVPGSVIPQEGVDALKTANWKDAHPSLTPIYERLDLFDVYGSVWFAAVYILLMVSLVGCIVPRLLVYARGLRAVPPAAPRNLTRLPDHETFTTADDPEAVLARARAVLAKRGYRLRPAAEGDPLDAVSAERGYLREAGNLLFHLAVLVVLVGFAIGGLLGFKGGVIIVQGGTFSNSANQYDDFVPGSLFRPDMLKPFDLTVDDFKIEWLTSGPRQGMARAFEAPLTYRSAPGAPAQQYDLRVNHPLTIDGTDVFLIGHGYAPVVTIRDGQGRVVYSGPTPFLPTNQSFLSFGVVKAPDAQPRGIGLEGLLYPTFASVNGEPFNVFGDDKNPVLSMRVYSGDLNMDGGAPQSVYVLDKSRTTMLEKADGKPYRLDLALGDTVALPNGLGSVSFDSIQPWVRVQISHTPGKLIALAGVVMALVGLIGSLFVRPRRVWVRARPAGPEDGSGTLVEVAALDRSGGGDVAPVLAGIVASVRGDAAPSKEE